MKTTTHKLLFTVFAFIYCVSVYSQERTCGMEDYMEEQMQNSVFAKEYQQNQEKFRAKLQQILSREDFSNRVTITIPVAIHFPNANESDRDCLETLAQNQIDILNEDFTGTNSDISQWTSASSSYPGINTGAADINFCLAVSNHPTGLDPELLEGEPCITIGYNFGGGENVDSNWAGYMNFVIRPLSILGFSPLGGSIAAGQAVTIADNAFGSGSGCSGSGVVPSAPYHLGRTTTHELGHFYNLDHTFTGSCATDDGIADTPNDASNGNYGCPSAGSVTSCSNTVLTMNYMDYVNDACMYIFTAGQTSVVDAYVSGVLQSQLKTNVCTPATPGFTLTANDSPMSSCPSTDTQVVFDLSYTTIQSFSETTTFSASGLPAGATVSFSPTTMNSDGNFTMTVGNLGATTQGEYTITITGTSATKTENIDVLLKNTCTTTQCNPYNSPLNLNLPIVDGNGGNVGTPVLTNVINIPNSATIESVTVNVDVTHTFVSDLLVRIVHPDGTTSIDVWSGDCGDNDNFDITFDDTAGSIACASPTVGTYAPGEALSAFNGLDAQGDWTILVGDFFAQDTGNLNDWSIEICSEEPLNVDELGVLDSFSIYPNPNNGEFNIGFNPKSGEAIKIEVYDIRGRSIYTNSYAPVSRFEEVVRLNNAQAGVYLLRIFDGSKTVTKKIIVD